MLLQLKKRLNILTPRASKTDLPEQKAMPTRKQPKLGEDTLKKNIESKLKAYRPVETDAKFTGPNYDRNL